MAGTALEVVCLQHGGAGIRELWWQAPNWEVVCLQRGGAGVRELRWQPPNWGDCPTAVLPPIGLAPVGTKR